MHAGASAVTSNYLDFTHSIEYPSASNLSLSTVAESLIGLERITRHIPDILNASPLGKCIVGIEVRVESITAGSLKDNVVYRLIFPTEADLDEWVKKVRKITGIQAMSDRFPVLGPIITGLLLIGGVSAVTYYAAKAGASSIKGNPSGSAINISQCRDVVIQQGAGTLNMKPAEYDKLLSTNSGNRFNLASNACRVILPASVGGGSIVVDEDANLSLSDSAVKEVPRSVERSPTEPQMELFEQENIELRAIDRDSTSKGWGVVVPRLCGKRLKVQLDPTVDRDAIATRATVKADIEMYYNTNAQGDRIYHSAYIRSVEN